MSWLGKNQEFHEVLVAARGFNPRFEIDQNWLTCDQPKSSGSQWLAMAKLQIPETDSGELVGGFSPLKPASTNRTMKLTKIRRSKLFRASFWSKCFRSNQIYAVFGVISLNLVRSQSDLVEISLDLAKSHQIQQDLHQIWWDFTVLAGFFHCGWFWPNRSLSNTKSDYSDLTPSSVNGGLNFLHPILLGQSWVGHKPNPWPTRGHP